MRDSPTVLNGRERASDRLSVRNGHSDLTVFRRPLFPWEDGIIIMSAAHSLALSFEALLDEERSDGKNRP